MKNIYAEFRYYLDAWKFCKDNKVPYDKITKKSFKVWAVTC